MNLWKVELVLLFRSWRGWTLVSLYLLATILSLLTNYFIDKANKAELIHYADVIEMYLLFSLPAGILFIGLVVSSMSFDANQNLSIFLRMRFSFKRILLTKLVVYVLLSEVLFLYLCSNIHCVNGNVRHDRSHFTEMVYVWFHV